MGKLGRLEKKAMLSHRHAEEGVRKAKALIQRVDLEGKRAYLELGCGGGHVTRYVATECGLSCTGTDVDPEMVGFAREQTKGLASVRFMTADATNLPFDDASFDLALSFGILHHINDWPTVISEVSRVLRPGGDYILGDFVYSRFSNALLNPIVRNYGIYTVDGLVEQAGRAGLGLAWRSPPKGAFFKYYALILEKEGDRGGRSSPPGHR